MRFNNKLRAIQAIMASYEDAGTTRPVDTINFQPNNINVALELIGLGPLYDLKEELHISLFFTLPGGMVL